MHSLKMTRVSLVPVRSFHSLVGVYQPDGNPGILSVEKGLRTFFLEKMKASVWNYVVVEDEDEVV